MNTEISVSFITTCKHRLAHLRQSLPQLVGQADAECIVVDYACPEGSAEWVRANHPSVRVVRVENELAYHQCRARNLGAAVARGRWLCFIDADVVVDRAFASNLLPLLRAGGYYRPNTRQPEAWGTAVCAREDFVAIEGYDEVMEGYGYKETDLYSRLEMLGCDTRPFPAEWLSVIKHDSDMRTQYYEIKDRWLNRRINMFYSLIKRDLSLQLDTLRMPLEQRRSIYQEVRSTVLRGATQGSSASTITINLPDSPELQPKLGWRMRREWIYRLEPDSSVQPGNQ